VRVGSAPVFSVRDIRARLAYYRDALGFDVTFEYGAPTYYVSLADRARLAKNRVDGFPRFAGMTT